MQVSPIPVLAIPHYNQHDLLLRCLRSIDHAIDRLVIVDNGRYEQKSLKLLEPVFATGQVRDFCHIWHPNAGVAGSWNEVIKLFPARYWLLVNDDIQFAPGDLAKMAAAADEPPAKACLYGNHGASFFIVTRRGVDRVGLFDENIYPAYLEDCDWSYRADLLGERRVNVPGIAAVHGSGKQGGSCTANHTPELARENSRTHGRNHTYYAMKWGGANGHERFKTPFNQPSWPVWAWRFDPYLRQQQQWKETP